MKILVTGAAGFIGFHTALQLLERGDSVVGFDSVNDYYDVNLKQARLDLLARHAKFEMIRANLADRTAVEACFKAHAFDRVIHLAAQAGVRYSLINPHSYVEANIVGFTNILESCRHAGAAHLTYASTSSVYGANTSMPFSEHQATVHPLQFYAATKRANELMAHSYSHLFRLPTTGLRFFTVYGPWGRPDMALFLFTRAILAGKPIRLFNRGDMRRDFTYVDDITEAVVKMVERPAAAGARLFNIGHGSPVPLTDFVAAIERALGRKAVLEMAPMQAGDVEATYACTERLRAEIGYAPDTGIEEGVARFVAWYRAHYAGKGDLAA